MVDTLAGLLAVILPLIIVVRCRKAKLTVEAMPDDLEPAAKRKLDQVRNAQRDGAGQHRRDGRRITFRLGCSARAGYRQTKLFYGEWFP